MPFQARQHALLKQQAHHWAGDRRSVSRDPRHPPSSAAQRECRRGSPPDAPSLRTLKTALGCEQSSCQGPPFTDEEPRPEFLRNCPKSHSQWVEGSGLEPRPWDPLVQFLLRSTAVGHSEGPYDLKSERGKMANLAQAPQARLGTGQEAQVNCRGLLSAQSPSSVKRAC